MLHAGLPDFLGRLLAGLTVLFALFAVAVVMAAPYFVSVIANIGRRPVVYRRPVSRRRLAPPRRVGV